MEGLGKAAVSRTYMHNVELTSYAPIGVTATVYFPSPFVPLSPKNNVETLQIPTVSLPRWGHSPCTGFMRVHQEVGPIQGGGQYERDILQISEFLP